MYFLIRKIKYRLVEWKKNIKLVLFIFRILLMADLFQYKRWIFIVGIILLEYFSRQFHVISIYSFVSSPWITFGKTKYLQNFIFKKKYISKSIHRQASPQMHARETAIKIMYFMNNKCLSIDRSYWFTNSIYTIIKSWLYKRVLSLSALFTEFTICFLWIFLLIIIFTFLAI